MSQRVITLTETKEKRYKATLMAPKENYFKFGHQEYVGVYGYKWKHKFSKKIKGRLKALIWNKNIILVAGYGIS